MDAVNQVTGPGGAATQDAPLVDAHAHIYRLDMPMPSTAWHRPTRDATLEDLLAELDAAGVRYAALAAASINGDYNDYMLEAVQRHPRLRTTVIVQPDIDPFILRMMKDIGVVGIRLQFRNVEAPPDLASFPYQKLLRRVADLDWHVHLHDEGDRLPQFLDHIERAGPKLVIDHFGRPPAPAGTSSLGFQRLLDSVERGNTWVKLSGAFRLQQPDLARALAEALIDRAGPERLLWGSDWPFAAYEDSITYAKAVDLYREIVPDPVVRQAIDRTAYDLYFRQG